MAHDGQNAAVVLILPMLLALLLVYLIALAAASRLATRLAGGSVLHTAALTVILFSVSLMLPAVYSGLISQLHLPGLLVLGAALWGAMLLLAARAAPLTAADFASGAQTPLRIALAVAAGLVVAGLVIAAQLATASAGPVVNVDTAWQYLPNTIAMWQSGTLFNYSGLSPYFPMGFEMLYIWEIAFTQSYRLVPAFQSLMVAGGLLYGALIVHLALRERPPFVRDAAAAVVVTLLAISNTPLNLLIETGKNDAFTFLCGMAAVYYLLRFWTGGRDARCVGLAALILGLYVSAKLTGIMWALALGGLHAALWWISVPGAGRLRAALRGGLALAGLFALPLLPWAVRLAANPGIVVDQAPYIAIGSGFTIARTWSAPEYTAQVGEWLPHFAAVAIGLLLLAGSGAPRIMGALLAIGAAWLLSIMGGFATHLGAFCTVIAASALVLVAHLRARQTVPPPAAFLFYAALSTMLLFAFVPFSGWIDVRPWLDTSVVMVTYRFTPATYPLFLIGLTVLAVGKLHPHQVNERERNSTRFRGLERLWAQAAVILAVVAVFGLGLLIDGVPTVQPRYANFLDRYAVPTAFFDWYDAHVQQAAVYAVNVPPLALYGRDLSSRVHYITPGRHGYYGDQAFTWAELAPFVEAQQIAYVVFGFSYPEVMQARLLRDAGVEAALAELRQRWVVVYEDEQIVCFATGESGIAQSDPAHRVDLEMNSRPRSEA